jgi:transcriptional regulator with GAF, ATPase, and Fis domain
VTPRTAAQAFADATSALTRGHDVTDVLARLIRDCAELLSADVIGLLVLNDQSDLEVLSSTTHGVTELELFQLQQEAGPCLDAIRSSALVSVTGIAAIEARWPDVGQAITLAGYRAVHAYPLRWHGHTLGAMNVFHRATNSVPTDQAELGQAFADIATILILQTTDFTYEQVTARVVSALHARTTIEQAKGVLSYQHNLTMTAAYDLLITMANADSNLTATASAILSRAQRGDR